MQPTMQVKCPGKERGHRGPLGSHNHCDCHSRNTKFTFLHHHSPIPHNNWVRKRTPGILALPVTCDPGRSEEPPTQVEPPTDQPQSRCFPRMLSPKELSRLSSSCIFLLPPAKHSWQSSQTCRRDAAGRQTPANPRKSTAWVWKLSSLVCTWKWLGRDPSQAV